jgi:hypothetical protein
VRRSVPVRMEAKRGREVVLQGGGDWGVEAVVAGQRMQAQGLSADLEARCTFTMLHVCRFTVARSLCCTLCSPNKDRSLNKTVRRPVDAARGLEDRLRVDKGRFFDRISRGLDGVEEEVSLPPFLSP